MKPQWLHIATKLSRPIRYSTCHVYVGYYAGPARPLDKLGGRIGPPILGAANFE